MFLRLLALACLLLAPPARAAGEPDVSAFLARAFPSAPAPAALWLTPELRRQARAATGDDAPVAARLRYWRLGERTAWVIDRVGKEAPITFGVVIERDAVVALEVLAYREHRGQEIQAPRWLAQFTGLRATASGLDRPVDNLTGATLSVRASLYVTRLALFAHRAAMTATASLPTRPATP